VLEYASVGRVERAADRRPTPELAPGALPGFRIVRTGIPLQVCGEPAGRNEHGGVILVKTFV
jgi:hypothetical protein